MNHSDAVRILLVDDDEDDQLLTREILNEIGPGRYRVDAFGTYELGRQAIARREHDVYLLDYHLGERSGLDLLREVTQAECAAPVILLTGVGDRHVDEAAVSAGAADYLVKGQMTPEQLERSIRYALERKRAEEQRVALIREQTARAEAEAGIRARDEFMWVAAHELKTPVTSMRLYAQLLLRHLQDTPAGTGQLRRAAETIESQSARLAHLVATLLDLARLQAGKLSVDVVWTNLTPLVEGVAQAARATTSAHRLVVQTGPEVWAAVDPPRFEQVVTNLVDNAIKYSPTGGLIELSLAQIEPEAVQLVVRDHGVGIPPDKQARVFEPFYQAHAVSQHSAGLGLGLHISRQIVELHGGHMRVESPADGGTAVLVTLPASTSAARRQNGNAPAVLARRDEVVSRA